MVALKARRTGAIALKVLRTLRHDPRSVALMLVAPILAMAIFGYAFGTEVGNVPTAVVNADDGDLAADVVANLDPDKVVVVTLTDWEAARDAVTDGTYRAALYFPPNFTEDATPRAGSAPNGGLLPGQQQPTRPEPANGTQIIVYADGSSSQMVAAVMQGVQEAVRETLEAQGGKSPIGVDAQYAYAADATFMDFFVPGIMAFAALLFTMLLTLLAFVGERTSGTLSRLLVTPVTEGEIVLGYALAFSLVGILQGAVLLGVAVLVFDVLVAGSLPLAFGIIALLAVDALSLGILLSAAAKREAQAIQFVPLVLFPTFLLSGIFVPVESLPGWLQPFAYAIPPTYAADALRSIMLRGWGVVDVLPQIAALAGFAVAFLLLAVAGLKRGRRMAA